MNGKDLLEAMGHVEECYVDEAEYTRLRKRLPLGWVSAAACLCILIAGAAFWLRPVYTNDCAMPESDGLDDMQMQETMAATEKSESGTEMMDSDCRIPYMVLRIDDWNEDGFTGTLCGEKESWGGILPGEEVTVLIKWEIKVWGDGEIRIPTEEDFPVGSIITVGFCNLREEDGKFLITATIIWDGESEGE